MCINNFFSCLTACTDRRYLYSPANVCLTPSLLVEELLGDNITEHQNCRTVNSHTGTCNYLSIVLILSGLALYIKVICTINVYESVFVCSLLSELLSFH